MHRSTTVLMVVLLTLALILAACSKPAPAPAPTPAPAPAPAPAETAADFYKKNTVSLVVTYGPGGGTDYGGRVVSTWWPDVTDGGALIVKNRAGGGGLVAMNEVYTAKPDGLTLGCTAWSTVVVAPFLAKDQAIKYDLTKFNWIGTYAGNEPAFGVSAKSPYNSMADLQKAKGLKFGSVGATNDWSMMEATVIELFGLDATIIPGFTSTAELQLALSKGEIDGVAAEMSVLRDTVDKGYLKPPLVTMYTSRSEWYPDTPTLPELVTLNADQQKLFDTIVNFFVAGKTLFAPPGVAADRVTFLRDAFMKLQDNKSFISMAKLRFYYMNPALPGDKVQQQAAALASAPPETGAGLVALLDKYVVK